MLTKSFHTDLHFLFNKLQNKEPFSFSKYADGEYKVLRNQPITNCDGWSFNPNLHQFEYQILMESFLYRNKEYYVGISCPCCQPTDHVQWMRDTVVCDNVTWANLFVNSNYEFFKDNFFIEFNNWEGDVTLVANEKGINKKLPFKVDEYISIQIGSWFNPELKIILEMMKEKATKNNQLFLFSAGPLGNILAHQLHMVNPNNTYIDIGSTINPWIVGNNRGYLNKKVTENKTCIW